MRYTRQRVWRRRRTGLRVSASVRLCTSSSTRGDSPAASPPALAAAARASRLTRKRSGPGVIWIGYLSFIYGRGDRREDRGDRNEESSETRVGRSVDRPDDDRPGAKHVAGGRRAAPLLLHTRQCARRLSLRLLLRRCAPAERRGWRSAHRAALATPCAWWAAPSPPPPAAAARAVRSALAALSASAASLAPRPPAAPGLLLVAAPAAAKKEDAKQKGKKGAAAAAPPAAASPAEPAAAHGAAPFFLLGASPAAARARVR